MSRDLGKWILPQPIAENEWVPIPKIGRQVPFGYKADDNDDTILIPVVLELQALEIAKKHLKQYSSRQVANWLTKQTGRTITHAGLLHRIKSEQSFRRKATTYRNIARRLEKAIEQAQKYEARLSADEKASYTFKDSYSPITDSNS
jgi:hypothetical protein